MPCIFNSINELRESGEWNGRPDVLAFANSGRGNIQ